MAQWSVDWVAPDQFNNSSVSWYIASVLGNGDSTATGDRQILTNIVATLVEGNAPLQAEALVSNISCGGANDGSIQLDVSGGVIPYKYQWSTGDTVSSLQNLGPGNYQITISDADTSSVVANATISESELLQLEVINTTNLGCSGQSNGSATLNISGGIAPYNLAWPDGDTALINNNLSIGNYEVIVFDDVGCSDTALVEITANINVQPNLVGIHESEPGANDGLAFINPSGGTPPYLVTWSNGSIGDTITNLAPGTYSVIVGDISGCLVADTVEILAGVCDLEITTQKEDLRCHGDRSGSAEVAFMDSFSVTSIVWSNGDTTQGISQQPAGLYTVQVVDSIGCIGIDTVELLQPESLVVELQSLSSASCSRLGSAIIAVGGGMEPYNINWSNGMEGDTIDDLQAGDYTVTVTDQNQCSSNLNISITTLDNTPPVLRRGEYTLYVGANGGVDLYSIPADSILFDACGIDSVWYSVAEFNCTSEATAVAVQAWDDEGNMLNAAFLVNVLDTIPPVADAINPLMVLGCDTVDYPIPTFLDNCGLDTVVILSGQNSGTVFPDGLNEVIFQAVDRSGNISIVSLIIDVDVDLEFIITKDEPACGSDSTGSIVILSDKDQNYSFQWSTGLINDTLQQIPAGNYSVTITDTLGCSAVEAIELEAGSIFEIQVDTIIPVKGDTLGSIDITVLGGQEPLSYQWLQNNMIFSDSEDLENAPDGTYIIQITDASGCQVMKTIDIGNTTRITTLQELGINIYPNPVGDQLTLVSRPIIDQVRIYNLSGQLKLSDLYHPRSIDLSTLSPGLYIIELRLAGNSYYRKLIKR